MAEVSAYCLADFNGGPLDTIVLQTENRGLVFPDAHNAQFRTVSQDLPMELIALSETQDLQAA